MRKIGLPTLSGSSKTFLSINKLPANIQKEVNILIDKTVLEFKDSIRLLNAQILNINSYLKDGEFAL